MPGLLQYFKRLGTSAHSAAERMPDFELAGHRFSEVQLAWRGSSTFVSRAGRMSWRGLMDDQPVRIIQCDNDAHASFVAAMVNRPDLQAYFPPCPLRIDRYVIFRWVEGEQFRWEAVQRHPDRLRQVARIQATLHALAPGIEPSAVGYSYLDFLKARFHRFRGIFPLDELARRVLDIIDSGHVPGTVRLAHPDVTGRNMVVAERTGQVTLVDNESLTQNDYFLIDLFNTHKSFGDRLAPELARPYLRHYVECGGNLAPLFEHTPYLTAIWHLRLMGYYLQNGKPRRALEIARHAVTEGTGPHPLVKLARQEYR